MVAIAAAHAVDTGPLDGGTVAHLLRDNGVSRTDDSISTLTALVDDDRVGGLNCGCNVGDHHRHRRGHRDYRGCRCW